LIRFPSKDLLEMTSPNEPIEVYELGRIADLLEWNIEKQGSHQVICLLPDRHWAGIQGFSEHKFDGDEIAAREFLRKWITNTYRGCRIVFHGLKASPTEEEVLRSRLEESAVSIEASHSEDADETTEE